MNRINKKLHLFDKNVIKVMKLMDIKIESLKNDTDYLELLKQQSKRARGGASRELPKNKRKSFSVRIKLPIVAPDKLKEGEKQPATKQLEPEAGEPMTPMSGEGSVSFTHPVEIVELPLTLLQVKRLSGDLATWGSYASADTSLQKMDVQCKTESEA